MKIVSGKTFVCYAHVDRDRFVGEFYTKLMGLGVDISIDDLDIRPGDSLPRKIFEECINDCENFIIVLSENSIDSKWVNEELDAGVIQKIENGARLIPIVLDNLARESVPTRLGHVALHYIKDLDSIDNDAMYIANVCHGNHDRAQPKPRQKRVPKTVGIPRLKKVDSMVYESIIEHLMARDEDYLEVEELVEQIGTELTTEELSETLEVLNNELCIRLEKTHGGSINDWAINVESYSVVLKYLKYCCEDADISLVKPVAIYILYHKNEWVRSDEMASKLGLNHFLLRHLIKFCEMQNYVLCSKELGTYITFRAESAGMRFFNECLD